jgi:hypothetical protein
MPNFEEKIRAAARKAAREEMNKSKSTATDYGAATVKALNTWSPERTASYKKWLEYLGPNNTTDTGKRDLAQIYVEEAAAKAKERKS